MQAGRNTKQKALILDALSSFGSDHVTADDIVDRLRDSGTPVAKSTVYRFLSSLEDAGELRKFILVEGQPACYQYLGDDPACREHYHLMCEQCGRIHHFESGLLARSFDTIAQKAGYQIDGRRTVFYGCCPECYAKHGGTQ